MTFTPEQINDFITNLENNDPSLTELNLQGQTLSAEQVSKIAGALKNNTHLVDLNLGNVTVDDKYIDDDLAIVIAEGLPTNTALKTLSLRLNSICNVGLIVLFRSLLTNTTLKSLDLSNNNHTNEINGRNEIHDGDNDILDINDLIAQSISEMLKINHSLTYLNLTGREFEGRTAAIIAQGLKNNFTLKRLSGISQGTLPNAPVGKSYLLIQNNLKRNNSGAASTTVMNKNETVENLANIFLNLAKSEDYQEMSYFLFRHSGKMNYFYKVLSEAYLAASHDMKKCLFSIDNFSYFIDKAKVGDADYLIKYFALNKDEAASACILLKNAPASFQPKC